PYIFPPSLHDALPISRYHGRPSYKIRVAFIAGSGELIHLQVNPGNTNGMKDLLSFVKEIEAMLPPEWIIEGIRADCGLADDAVIDRKSTRLNSSHVKI